MAAVQTEGKILHFSSAKLNGENDDHKKNQNKLFTCDFTCDGARLVVGGSDRNLYVYDEVNNAHTFLKEMSSKDMTVTGHSNRVNCIKGHPTNPHLVISAGWDNTLKIYDVEKGYPIASIGGTEVSGDSIDIFEDMLLTGSYRNHSEMSIYSASQHKLVFNWDFQRRLGD